MLQRRSACIAIDSFGLQNSGLSDFTILWNLQPQSLSSVTEVSDDGDKIIGLYYSSKAKKLLIALDSHGLSA